MGKCPLHSLFLTGIADIQQEDLSVMPQTNMVRTLSFKDVVSSLERDPQMSKSTFMYSLYGKMYDTEDAKGK